MIKISGRFIAFAMAIFLIQGCTRGPGKTSENERLLMATLYQQSAAEYDALCYQAYNLAEFMIQKALEKNISGDLAVITDIDETVLDNSPYEASCILDNISFPDEWNEWCELAKAKALPGSREFLNYVANQGIQVFYITNRKSELMQPTLTNLQKEGFPFADESHLIMAENDNSKESRRKIVEGKYHVILLLGDNLEDFTNVFENKSPEERKEIVSTLSASFGTRFIAFPNAMYGSWERSIYGQSEKLGLKTKEETRYHFLTPFLLSKKQ